MIRRYRSFTAFAALLVVAVHLADWEGGFVLYGVLAFGLLGLKGIAAATAPAPATPTDADRAKKVGVIYTVYNEDPEMLRQSVRAMLEQPNVVQILLVDDASTDPGTRGAVREIAYWRDARTMSFTQPVNAGKREALKIGSHLLMGHVRDLDYIMTIDSDTIVLPDCVLAAVAEAGKYPAVAAITGMVRAHNWDRNVLTRLQDIRYANSFLWERAAYSRAGSVLCVCGALTLWKAEVFDELVDSLVEQTFLGESCTFGDDRHLTNLALRAGWEIRFTEAAVGETLVPERWPHWIRQQVRWSKSFIRETLWSVGRLPIGTAWTFAVVEMLTTILFSGMMIASVVVFPAVYGQVAIVSFFLWIAVSSWARSVRWIDARPNQVAWVDVATAALLAPLYGVVHLVLVIPLRFYALSTLTTSSWGTREEIEVAA